MLKIIREIYFIYNPYYHKERGKDCILKEKSLKKVEDIFAHIKKSAYLCIAFEENLSANKVDSLAQQVEHIPFKDGVLGSSPRRITKESQTALLFLFAKSTSLFITSCTL